MKLITIVFFISTLMVGSLSAQTPSPEPTPEKKLTRNEQKALKREREESEKQVEAERSKRTVELKTLSLFPDRYLDAPVRLQYVQIHDIGIFRDQEEPYFLMNLSSNNHYAPAYWSTNGVAFIVSETMARPLTNKLNLVSGSQKYIVDMWVTMGKMTGRDEQTYFYARVNCIQFRSNRGGHSSMLGKCPM